MGADALIGRRAAQSNPRRVIPPEGREPPPMAAAALNVHPPEKNNNNRRRSFLLRSFAASPLFFITASLYNSQTVISPKTRRGSFQSPFQFFFHLIIHPPAVFLFLILSVCYEYHSPYRSPYHSPYRSPYHSPCRQFGSNDRRRREPGSAAGALRRVILFGAAIRRANRTFVRLGALTGACSALRVAAAVCAAGYCAWVRPAVAAGCARGRGAP